MTRFLKIKNLGVCALDFISQLGNKSFCFEWQIKFIAVNINIYLYFLLLLCYFSVYVHLLITLFFLSTLCIKCNGNLSFSYTVLLIVCLYIQYIYFFNMFVQHFLFIHICICSFIIYTLYYSVIIFVRSSVFIS